MQVKLCVIERYKIMSDGERMDNDQLFSFSHNVRNGNKQKDVVHTVSS